MTYPARRDYAILNGADADVIRKTYTEWGPHWKDLADQHWLDEDLIIGVATILERVDHALHRAGYSQRAGDVGYGIVLSRL